MKKIITSVIAALALTANVFAQTGERFLPELGKNYAFCVRGEENLVLAHYGEEQAFVVEPYQEGNQNQLMALACRDMAEEGYLNLYNVASGYTWNDKGVAVPATNKNDAGEWILDTWISWDLELDEEGYVRIVHFLERWGWSATYEPQYMGVIMMLSGDELAPLMYSRSPASGVRDHTEYESYAGQFFDFKIKEIGASSGLNQSDVEKVTIAGGVGSMSLNNLNEGASVVVCSVDGKQMKSLKAETSNLNLDIASGMYLVKVDNKSFKVVVR